MAQGLDFSRLDGTTKAKDRVQIVKEFNSSTHINLCLVSTMLVEENKNTRSVLVMRFICSFCFVTFFLSAFYTKIFFFLSTGQGDSV